VAQLAMSNSFLPQYAKLEPKVRKAVDAAIAKFAEHSHAGLHLEKINHARDPRIRTIRIDQYWRGVVLAPEQGDVFCLITVLGHDEAIRHAASRRFSVNQAIGVIEVRDQDAIDSLEPVLEQVSLSTDTRLFTHVSDKEMARLGIDDAVMPVVRLLINDVHLQAMEKMLPEPQYVALLALAEGMTVEQAWAEVAACLPPEVTPTPVAADDLVTAMRRSPGQIVFLEGPEDLRRVLAHPFDAWRIFLHPLQRKVALRESYPGSAQVTGGAGTGKTVTALHRAKHLALRNEQARILLTTFTASLARTLEKQLELIVDDPVIRGRVEVGTVDSVAFGVVSRHRGRPNIVSKDMLDSFWHDAAEKLPYSPVFLAREWEQVILAQNLTTEDAYLACSRSGRGVPLSKKQRAVVWQAIATVVDRLAETGTSTFHQLVAEAALLTAGTPGYEHVLVDEAQDLHPNQWRLLRALVPDGPDDLFIVGDPHQRIYDSNVSLKRLEIKVHGGRSTRLKLNYRTTQEILNWAIPVLGLIPPTGLDDAPDTLIGYRSPLHGRRPVVSRFAHREAELEGLARQVRRWLDDGIEPNAIGVTARRKYLLSEASERLNAEGIKTFQAPSRSMGVQVGTMHSMKGLEFRCVAVIGVEDEMVPLRSAVTPEDEDAKAHNQDLQKERCLLFVACTRTRDHLYVSHTGTPSPFLPA
jgi:hypothetical protein